MLRSYLEFMSVEDGVIIDREEGYSEVPRLFALSACLIFDVCRSTFDC